MSTKNFEKYTKVSYSGRKLLREHNLNEYGIWQVMGEDSNCDWGGSHYQPELGIYEGTLLDVVILAVELPGFWQWGAGGNIIKKNVEKVDNTTEQVRADKRKRLTELEAERDQLRKDLSLI